MGSSQIRDWPRVSCIGRRFLYHWATREALSELIWTQSFSLIWPLQIKVRATCPGGDCRLLDLSTSLVSLCPGSSVDAERECDVWRRICLQTPWGSHALRAPEQDWVFTAWQLHKSVREGTSVLSPCSSHSRKSILIQNKNQMYRALGVEYEILLRLKRKRKSDVFIWLHSVFESTF